MECISNKCFKSDEIKEIKSDMKDLKESVQDLEKDGIARKKDIEKLAETMQELNLTLKETTKELINSVRENEIKGYKKSDKIVWIFLTGIISSIASLVATTILN